jgi:polysaccharide export outer membrane protein
MLTFRSFLGFCFLAFLSSVSAAQQPATLGANTDRYRIGFQDVLDVQVFRHPELNQRVSVSPAGTITLFRLENPITAVCKTDRELAAAIAEAYREKYLRDPQVNVVVAEQRSQPVGVIGAVEKPGSFFLSRKVHLLELLAMAGGPNKEAGTRLLVARAGNAFGCPDVDPNDDDTNLAVIDFKIRDIQEGKRTFWLEPGDVVSILDADIIYVYGNVNKQGSIRVREPITLTQAIASSEGLKSNAKKERIRVLRQSPGSLERQEIIFDLNQIDKGRVIDPFLEPNDIVAISEDRMKTILQGVANSVRSSIPSAIYRIP